MELEEEQWNNIWLEDEEEEDVFANLDPELTKLIHNNTSSSLSSSSSSLLLPLKTAVDGGINPSSSSLSLENTDDGTPETFYLECYCESRLGADGRKTAEIPIRKVRRRIIITRQS